MLLNDIVASSNSSSGASSSGGEEEEGGRGAGFISLKFPQDSLDPPILPNSEAVVTMQKKRKRVSYSSEDEYLRHQRPPWLRRYIKPRRSEFYNPIRFLDKDIYAFKDYICPTRGEHTLRKLVVRRIENVVKELWPEAELRVFGSFDTFLYLPTSDIDLVVFTPDGDQGSKKTLYKLAVMLKRQRIAKNVQVIDKARVPIIKFEDSLTDIAVDICFNMDSGINSAKATRRYLKEFPAARYLILIIKQMLMQRYLNEVHTGGLGSYAILILVISFLQRHPVIQEGFLIPEENLGVLFLEFLELYGLLFPYETTAIAIHNGGKYFSKDSVEWQSIQDRHRANNPNLNIPSHLLALVDPEDPKNDVSRGSFAIMRVRQVFCQAFEVLTSSIYEIADGHTKDLERYGVLGKFIKVSSKTIRKRDQLEKLYQDPSIKKQLEEEGLLNHQRNTKREQEEVEEEEEEEEEEEGEITKYNLPPGRSRRAPSNSFDFDFTIDDESDQRGPDTNNGANGDSRRRKTLRRQKVQKKNVAKPYKNHLISACANTDMDAITEFRCKTQAMSISSNAKQNLLAVGTIKGEVSCIKLSSNSSQEIPTAGAVETSGASSGDGEKSDLTLETSFTIRPSKKCCRAVSFNEPGSVLYSGFKDRSIQGIDLTNQAITWNIPEAHSCPLNTLKVLSNNLLASGDEQGQVKVWDIRQVKECHTFLDNEDYIADMTYAERKKTLIAAGKNEWEWGRGDGYLSVFDLRKSALLARSDNMEDELLSVVMVKNGTKVLCGTQLGIVCFFNWGDWGDLKDRFVGHPSSIEAMAVIDQDTICTGASDGLVRICSILPNKMLGIVADHQGFPVERLTITGVDQHDRWLATCSHDEIVRIFDISFLYHQQQQQQQQEQGEEEGSDKEEVVKNNKRMLKPMKNPQKLRKKQELNEFFADL